MKQTDSYYSSVLFYYDLYPRQIEDFGKVKKITTGRGVYALKETSLSMRQADDFIHALRKLEKVGYSHIVPVIPTKYGEYIVSTSTHTYYLMPWVDPVNYSAKVSQEELIAAELGIIHRLTIKTQSFEKEQVQHSYEQLLRRWEIRSLELSRFADQAERKVYMSPFELSFLTHAHMLERMAEVAKEHLKKWYETFEEKGTYRTVLCHGRVHRAHSLFTPQNQPLLLNFEKASIDTPARDIASFCRYSFPKAYWSEDEVLRWFGRYEQHLPLLEEEKHLICAYLNFPEPIAFAVEAYVKRTEPKRELEHVQRLEKRLTSMRKVQRLTQKLFPIVDQFQAQEQM